MTRRYLMLVSAGLALSTAACNLISGMVQVLPPPKQKVAAEYSRLAGKKVVILTWVQDDGALVDFPYAQAQLSAFAAVHLKEKVDNITIVSTARVEDYLERSYDPVPDPVEVGKRFSADVVVFLEVFRLSLRDPATPQLYQGRIEASVRVYDRTAGGEGANEFELTPIEVRVPENRTIGVVAANAAQILRETYDAFGAAVAKRFHDHEVEL